METITLADGTVIRNAQTIGAVVGLWVHVYQGLTLNEAFSLFSDPAKTATPEAPTVFEGYTDLFMIKREDTGMIMIGLHKATTP